MLEVLTHVGSQEDAGGKPAYFTVDLEDRWIKDVPTDELPRGWRPA